MDSGATAHAAFIFRAVHAYARSGARHARVFVAWCVGAPVAVRTREREVVLQVGMSRTDCTYRAHHPDLAPSSEIRGTPAVADDGEE